MSTFLCPIGPIIVLSPTSGRRRMVNTFLQGTHFGLQRSSAKDIGIARLGLGEVPFLDPGNSEMVVKDLFGRLDGFLYAVADAAVTSADTLDGASTAKQDGDWLSGIANSMELVLKVLKDVLSTLHVPYAYGFAIILLTIIVKGATFPLTKKQVESAMAMQTLAPQIKAIQQRYAGDQERIQLETARLYKLSGINPLAGCLPTLLTIPIWIGLYRALSNVANEELLNEGFFWIPSLSGPTTIADRQTGSGTSWLFPFIDGHPPLGWPDTFAYLVLPLLLVLSQYISIQIMQPPQSDDPNVKNSQAITKFLPLMIGYFSLSVPSGLSLYWFTNNILSTAQQVWLRKMRGAKNPVMKSSSDILSQDQFPATKQRPKAPSAVKEVAEKGETSADVPRRGERFKQLKEQEAQRRQLREDQSQKAEDATTQITSDEQAATRVPVNGNGSIIELEANDDTRPPVNLGNSDDKENGRSDLHPDKNVD